MLKDLKILNGSIIEVAYNNDIQKEFDRSELKYMNLKEMHNKNMKTTTKVQHELEE